MSNTFRLEKNLACKNIGALKLKYVKNKVGLIE